MSKKYALLIGVGDYQDLAIPALKKPIHDVIGISKILTNPRIGGFSEQNVDMLINPTFKLAQRTIYNFFQSARREDLLLLYFAGHGFLIERQLHLALLDTEKEYIALESVSATFIATQMVKSRAKEQVLMLDCCHSGAFESPPGLKASANVVVLAASDRTEFAWEDGDSDYSLFTHHFIEGLEKGQVDCDADGCVSVEEVYKYIRKKLISSSQKPVRLYPFGRQEDQIIIAKSPSFVNLHDSSFVVNDIKIPYMIPEYLFLGENSISKNDIRSIYENTEILLPEKLLYLKDEHIHKKLEEAKTKGLTFDNNLSYSLYSLSTERVQSEDGARRNQYLMTLRPTDYYSFVFPNLALDQSILCETEETTPRKMLGLNRENIRIENLQDHLCHFRIGTGTIFITSDNLIVVSLRSRTQFVAGGATYHLSTAEGMLRPVDEQNDQPSPFLTSIRSLSDELGLQVDEDFLSQDMRCIGIFLDALRLQPYFVFYIRSSRISFQDLKERWILFAKDKQENRDVIGLEWDLKTAKLLVKGKMNYNDTFLEVASNHALTGFVVASLHEFGRAFLK